MRRAPLRPVSKKRAREWAARANVITEVIERDGPYCRAKLLVPEVACWGPLDADEWELRSARPGGHLDPDNVQLLCRLCHSFKHQEPNHAAILGLRSYPYLLVSQLPEAGPLPGDVRAALRALAKFKAGALHDPGVLSPTALEGNVSYALRAAEGAWHRWQCRA